MVPLCYARWNLVVDVDTIVACSISIVTSPNTSPPLSSVAFQLPAITNTGSAPAPLSEINISQDSERVAGPKQEQKLIILSEEKLQGGICSVQSGLLRRLASICWN